MACSRRTGGRPRAPKWMRPRRQRQDRCSDTDANLHTSEDSLVSEDTSEVWPSLYKNTSKGSSSDITVLDTTTTSDITVLDTTDECPTAEFETDDDELHGRGDRLVAALSTIYKSMVDSSTKSSTPTQFHCVRPPPISVEDYVERLHKYFLCSDACFIISFIYIDRLVQRCPKFSVTALTFHRLLATSLMMSAKFQDDVYYSNAYYAKAAGLKLKEINALEALFLKSIDWRTNVSTETYEENSRKVLEPRLPNDEPSTG